MISFDSRKIVRYARARGITLKRGNTEKCALGVLALMNNTTWEDLKYNLKKYSYLESKKFWDFERGFEGWYSLNGKKSRYYRAGERVAKLAGLSVDY